MSLNQQAGEFIKAKREALGWTQEHLGIEVFGKGKTEFSKKERDNFRARISPIENGKKISNETLDKILTAMNCFVEFKEN